MACSFSDRISAYHDGELDVAARGDVQRHLAQCPACAAELAELAAVSEVFAASAPPRLSQMGRHRLHNKLDLVVREDVLRMARYVQAIAACVLVAASIWLMQTPQSTPAAPDTVQAAPPQLDIALTVSAETNHLDSATATPAVAWYLADASSRADEP